MSAVEQYSRSLKYASDEMKNNQAIVKAAMTRSRSDPQALHWASDAVKNDKDFVMSLVQMTWSSGSDRDRQGQPKTDRDGPFRYVSDEMKNDEEVAVAAVQSDKNALHFASDEIKNNGAVVMAEVQKNGHALKWSSN